MKDDNPTAAEAVGSIVGLLIILLGFLLMTSCIWAPGVALIVWVFK